MGYWTLNMLTRLVNGKPVELTSQEETELNEEWAINDEERQNYIAFEKYKDDRASEYPEIGDQLDALWHAMDDGRLTKIAEFYDPIKIIKDKYPKPL